MGFRGRKISRRGLIVITALLFGIALSSGHSGQASRRLLAPPQSEILTMLSKNPEMLDRAENKARKIAVKPAILPMVLAASKTSGTKKAPTITQSSVLQVDEQWTARSVHLVQSVVVPNGVTLTIEPGTIVKVTSGSTGITVETGGSLRIAGTQERPVFITSARDDTVLGDTDNNGKTEAHAHDYATAVEVLAGGSLEATHTLVRYATNGFMLRGDARLSSVAIDSVSVAIDTDAASATITDASITNAHTGLVVGTLGKVAYRGTFAGITDKAIQSCAWQEACSLDASFAGWQDAQPPQLCGKVLAGSWSYANEQLASPEVFGVNCANTPTPAQYLLAAADYFQSLATLKTIACNEGATDTCSQRDAAYVCIESGVMSLGQSPYVRSDSGEAELYSRVYLKSLSDQIVASAQPVPNVAATQQLDAGIATVQSLAAHYASCAPQ